MKADEEVPQSLVDDFLNDHNNLRYFYANNTASQSFISKIFGPIPISFAVTHPTMINFVRIVHQRSLLVFNTSIGSVFNALSSCPLENLAISISLVGKTKSQKAIDFESTEIDLVDYDGKKEEEDHEDDDDESYGKYFLGSRQKITKTPITVDSHGYCSDLALFDVCGRSLVSRVPLPSNFYIDSQNDSKYKSICQTMKAAIRSQGLGFLFTGVSISWTNEFLYGFFEGLIDKILYIQSNNICHVLERCISTFRVTENFTLLPSVFSTIFSQCISRTLLGLPYDNLKIRLLMQSSQAYEMKYRGPFSLLKTIKEEEGLISGLYLSKSLMFLNFTLNSLIPIIQIAPIVIMKLLSSYGLFTNPSSDNKLFPLLTAISLKFSSICLQLLIKIPANNILRRLTAQSILRRQMYMKNSVKPFILRFSTLRYCNAIGEPYYKGFFDALFKIPKEEGGIGALFLGWKYQVFNGFVKALFNYVFSFKGNLIEDDKYDDYDDDPDEYDFDHENDVVVD